MNFRQAEGFCGFIICDIVLPVQQQPHGCLVVSFPSKSGQTLFLDVILKMRCSCVLVKPDHISEITSSAGWVDFWRFGCDRDWILFLGFSGHCSMEILQKQPLSVPFCFLPQPCGSVDKMWCKACLTRLCQCERCFTGRKTLPKRDLRTWKPAWKLLRKRVNSHGRMSES